MFQLGSCYNVPANNSSGVNTLSMKGNVNNSIVFNDILYITNDLNNTVSACPLNKDGSLGFCNVSTGSFNSPKAIWIQ